MRFHNLFLTCYPAVYSLRYSLTEEREEKLIHGNKFISPYLFIIAVESLAMIIKEENNIQGFGRNYLNYTHLRMIRRAFLKKNSRTMPCLKLLSYLVNVPVEKIIMRKQKYLPLETASYKI